MPMLPAATMPIRPIGMPATSLQVINRLNRTTTIHWHGMRQHGTPDMDGTPGISQDAIAPGAAFTYTFVAAAPGTYW